MSKLLLALYIITTSSALIILKLGTKSGVPVGFSDGKLSFNINYLVLTGLFLYVFSFITYVYLISKYDLGYVIPLTAAFVYLIIFVASAVIFNEVFTVVKISGIALIVAGLVLLNL